MSWTNHTPTPTPETRYRAALERIRDFPESFLDRKAREAMAKIAREALEQESVRVKVDCLILCPKCGTETYVHRSDSSHIMPCPKCGTRLKVEF